MKRTFDVFLLPEIVQELKMRGELTVAKIYTDPVEQGKKKSRYGYEGDMWYIPEQGRYVDSSGQLFIFSADTAIKRVGLRGVEIIPPVRYEDAAIKVHAKDMPVWAARTWVEITEVIQPRRVQQLSEADILSIGFRDLGYGEYSIGEQVISGASDLVTVFSLWWNDNMGGWRVINKGGVPNKLVCYPYADGMNVRPYPHSSLERTEFPNPWVISYALKLLPNKGM